MLFKRKPKKTLEEIHMQHTHVHFDCKICKKSYLKMLADAEEARIRRIIHEEIKNASKMIDASAGVQHTK